MGKLKKKLVGVLYSYILSPWERTEVRAWERL
jgi:hypothetical protein